MTKKGQLSELYIIILLLITFSISTIFVLNFFLKFNEATSGVFVNESAAVMESTANTFTVLDNAYVFLIGGLVLALIVSAFFIQTNPIFFIVFLVGLLVTVIVSAPISNMFMNLTASEQLSNATIVLPNTVLYTSQLPLIVMIAGIIFIIVLYAKGWFTSG